MYTQYMSRFSIENIFIFIYMYVYIYIHAYAADSLTTQEIECAFTRVLRTGLTSKEFLMR